MFHIKQVSLLVLGLLFIKGPGPYHAGKHVRHSSRSILHTVHQNLQLVNTLREEPIGISEHSLSGLFKTGSRHIKNNIDSSEVLVGKKAPDFKLNSFDGKVLSLNHFKGKVVILDFWATWCKPCLVELPIVQKVYQDFKKEGLVVLGMNAEKVSTAQSFIKKHNYTFTNLHDTDRNVAHEKYYVHAIPSVFVIDRKGKISSYLVGTHSEGELRKAVQKEGL